jgi:hypothetical protein
MAKLTDLPRALARVTRDVLGQVRSLSLQPWELENFAQGVPAPPPEFFAQVDELLGLEAAGLDLADLLEILDGLRDAYGAVSDHDPADLFARLFGPLLLCTMRADPSWRPSYPFVAAVLAADDALAEHSASRMLPDRYTALALRLWREAAGQRSTDINHLATWLTLSAVATAYPVIQWGWAKLSKRFWEEQRPADLSLALGWESDLPQRDSAFDEPARPTSTWSAQRTFSLRREGKPAFAFADYDEASTVDAPRASARHWSIACAPSAVEHAANAGEPPGPALWFAFDIAEGLGDWHYGNWSTRLRGHGNGVRSIPFGEARTATAAGAGLEFEAVWAPTVDDEVDRQPDAGDCSFTVGGVAITAFGGGGVGIGEAGPAVAADEAGVAIRLTRARLALAPSSALARAILRGGLTLEADLGLRLTTHRGLVLEGSGGLDLYLAIERAIGNRWLGASISYLRLRLIVDSGPAGAGVTVEATAGVAISIFRVTLTLEGLGARLAVRTRTPRGNLLGIADVAGEVITPPTFGLAIDWGPIRGGGVFAYEADQDRYWGALELAWGKRWALRGVGFCEGRTIGDGATARTQHSLVALVTWERASVSPGFDLTGVGVFVGTHRRADGDALREGVVSGALDALLFPPDPVGQARSLVAALERFFPAAEPDADTHVVGVLLKLSFAGGLASARLGFLVQFGAGTVNRTKLFVAFAAKLALRGALARVVKLEMAGVGEYDAATGDLEVRARLRNSRLCGANLDGELLVFRGDPLGGAAAPAARTDLEALARPGTGWFFSLGGYHPRWFDGKGPGRARVDQRIAVTVHKGDALTMEWSGYLALTPSAIHLGARARVALSAGGFGIEGLCGFDGMVTYDWDFVLDVFGQVRLILFSRTLCDLGLEGTLRGTSPWSIAGRVKYKILWWSGSKCFSKQLTDDTEPAPPPPSLATQVRTALAEPAAYADAAPGAIASTKRERTGLWGAPERGLRATQTIAPLGVAVTRLGAVRLPRPTAAAVTSVELGGAPWPHRAVTAAFAPGTFFDLTTAQALTAPAAETLDAGFEVAHDAIAVGGEQEAIARYDAITIDRGQTAGAPRPREVVGLPPEIHLAELARRAPPPPPPRQVRVAPAEYARPGVPARGRFATLAATGAPLRRARAGVA